MISTLEELVASKSSFERTLEPLRSSKKITPEFILELESQSLATFKVTAQVAKSSDNLDEIARHWWDVYVFFDLAHDLLQAISEFQPATQHTDRVLGVLDQLRKRARRLHDLHA
jgi:hypothetical protein